jgi:GGDEF domain-containing protein
MLLVVDMFSTLKEQYGYEFEDKLLRVVADKICDVVGTACVVGHIYADHFVVLLQDETDEEAQGVGTRIVDALAAIPEVDGIPFTVFARHSEARFSEVKDSRELHRLARARLIRREMGR